MSNALCAVNSELIAHEGSRHRDVRVTFDGAGGKAHYTEKNIENGKILREENIDIPPCVHDVLGALYRLRSTELPPGQATEFPVSDGKKSVKARVEAQAIEKIRTPAGEFETIRYEVFLFKGILYRRDARLFVWLTNDAKRVPAQIQVRMRFYVGTVTIQLEGEEK